MEDSFNTPTKDQTEEIEKALDFAYCIDDPTSIMTAGNFQVEFWKGFMINVARCSGKKKNCKTKEEIDSFLDNLYLYAFFNEQKYDPNSYEGNPISKQLK